jgi:hypothetical protein
MRYCTDSTKVLVCETDPAVAVTVTVLFVAAVVVPELPPQPEMTPNPAMPITRSTISCRMRFRFLKPRKQSATARVATGNRGREYDRGAMTGFTYGSLLSLQRSGS